MRKMIGAKRYMAIKFDFEKAYDQVRWLFMRGMLEQMQFPLALVHVIFSCISTCTMNMLWLSLIHI